MSANQERKEARRRAELLKLLTSMVRQERPPGMSKTEARAMAADAMARTPGIVIKRIC